jgi:hypothetical protein
VKSLLQKLEINIGFGYNAFFLLLSCAILFFLTISLINIQEDIIIRHDFRSFYTGALMISEGVRDNFYNLSSQEIYQNSFLPLNAPKYLSPFVYLPIIGAIISPLTSYSLKIAFVTLGIFNLVLLLFCSFLLIRVTNQRFYKLPRTESPRFSGGLSLNHFTHRAAEPLTTFRLHPRFEKAGFWRSDYKYRFSLIPFILTFSPAWETFSQTQLSILLLLTFVGSFLLMRKEKLFLAGLLLSFLLFRPQLILLPIFVLLIKRQWQILKGIVFGSFLLISISIYLVGLPGLLNYPHLILDAISWGDKYTMHPQLEPTWRGFIHQVFQTTTLNSIFWYWLSGVIIAIFLLIKYLRGQLVFRSAKFGLQWAMLILITLVTSLHTNFHDLTLLLFPLTLIISSNIPLRVIGKWNPMLLLYLYLLLIFVWIFFTNYLQYPFFAVPFYVFIFLFLYKPHQLTNN